MKQNGGCAERSRGRSEVMGASVRRWCADQHDTVRRMGLGVGRG